MERLTKIKAELVLVAVNPVFDKNHKRRFLAFEKILPNGQRIERVAALGGHSKRILRPPGYYQLGKEALSQLAPLVHNTSAMGPIQKAGFLSRQGRIEEINFISKEKEACYRPEATHAAVINTDLSIKMGFFSLEIAFQRLSAAQVNGKMEIGMVSSL